MVTVWRGKRARRRAALDGAGVMALAGCCLLLALLLGSGTAAPAVRQTVLGEKAEWQVISGADAPLERTLTVTREQWMQGPLMLSSPQHPLPPDYPAPDTRTVQAVAGSFLPAEEGVALRAEVIYALCRMQAEKSITGQAFVSRGTVSYAQQEQERRAAFSRYAAVYSLAEAAQKAAAAVPGGNESEHRTGWAADITLTGPLNLGERNPLERSEAGRWMAENLWRFGLIQRFAPGSGDEGDCESVHLRYVGPAHAAAMRTLGLGLEDYLLLLRREGAVTLLKDGQPCAYFFCVPEAEAVTLTVPRNAEVEISGDNTGSVIAAVTVPGVF